MSRPRCAAATCEQLPFVPAGSVERPSPRIDVYFPTFPLSFFASQSSLAKPDRCFSPCNAPHRMALDAGAVRTPHFWLRGVEVRHIRQFLGLALGFRAQVGDLDTVFRQRFPGAGGSLQFVTTAGRCCGTGSGGATARGGCGAVTRRRRGRRGAAVPTQPPSTVHIPLYAFPCCSWCSPSSRE